MDKLLRQDFLNRTLDALCRLVEEARGEDGEVFSENFRREAFRSLHTIKGTAQTIGFPASGKFAHELENLLTAASVRPKNSPRENYKALLVEGLNCLKKTFEQTDYEIPAAFLESIGAHIPAENGKAQTDFAPVPEWIFRQLTNYEKSALAAALRNEKEIFCLEINFESANFADEFLAVRQTLCEKCEIIAALPAAGKKSAPGKIGFQILIATGGDIGETIEKTRAEIVFQSSASEPSNHLKSVLAQAVAIGETCAKKLGKQVDFQIAAAKSEEEISPELLKTIFDALNHLIRNAVDHAIETVQERGAKNKSPRGTIKIDFTAAENGFYLSVADDGRGVDARKIKAAATKKNLISNGDDLTEKETLELIFLPEFSTRPTATEISGRGVGLDAVKMTIEKAGGAIGVKSKRDKGTTFEIFLPREDLD